MMMMISRIIVLVTMGKLSLVIILHLVLALLLSVQVSSSEIIDDVFDTNPRTHSWDMIRGKNCIKYLNGTLFYSTNTGIYILRGDIANVLAVFPGVIISPDTGVSYTMHSDGTYAYNNSYIYDISDDDVVQNVINFDEPYPGCVQGISWNYARTVLNTTLHDNIQQFKIRGVDSFPDKTKYMRRGDTLELSCIVYTQTENKVYGKWFRTSGNGDVYYLRDNNWRRTYFNEHLFMTSLLVAEFDVDDEGLYECFGYDGYSPGYRRSIYVSLTDDETKIVNTDKWWHSSPTPIDFPRPCPVLRHNELHIMNTEFNVAKKYDRSVIPDIPVTLDHYPFVEYTYKLKSLTAKATHEQWVKPGTCIYAPIDSDEVVTRVSNAAIVLNPDMLLNTKRMHNWYFENSFFVNAIAISKKGRPLTFKWYRRFTDGSSEREEMNQSVSFTNRIIYGNDGVSRANTIHRIDNMQFDLVNIPGILTLSMSVIRLDRSDPLATYECWVYDNVSIPFFVSYSITHNIDLFTDLSSYDLYPMMDDVPCDNMILLKPSIVITFYISVGILLAIAIMGVRFIWHQVLMTNADERL